jgi:hypothetical protein
LRRTLYHTTLNPLVGSTSGVGRVAATGASAFPAVY